MADLDLVQSILDTAAARHGRQLWRREHVERGILADETLLGGYSDLAATATLQSSDAELWGPGSAVAPEAIYLHRLAAAVRGQGLGAAMLPACESRSRAAGIHLVRLDSGSGRLRAYYRDLGYSEVREIEGPNWRQVLFEKKLVNP